MSVTNILYIKVLKECRPPINQHKTFIRFVDGGSTICMLSHESLQKIEEIFGERITFKNPPCSEFINSKNKDKDINAILRDLFSIHRSPRVNEVVMFVNGSCMHKDDFVPAVTHLWEALKQCPRRWALQRLYEKYFGNALTDREKELEEIFKNYELIEYTGSEGRLITPCTVHKIVSFVTSYGTDFNWVRLPTDWTQPHPIMNSLPDFCMRQPLLQ